MPVASRVPRRTMMDCRNRWTILAEMRTSRTSTTDLLPRRSGGSRQPWTDIEIKRLVEGVKTHGEWGKAWTWIAAFVFSRSEAECRLKWLSTKPVWTPEEDMLLAAAVKVCDKGYWTPVASRVPRRTMMDCRNRWTILAEMRTSRTSTTDLLPRRSGGATNPVGELETCKEGNEATIAAVVPGLVRSEPQRVVKLHAVPNHQPQGLPANMGACPSVPNHQPKGLPANMGAPRSSSFSSVNDGAWVSHHFPLPGQRNPQFHSKLQHMSSSAAAVPNQPMGVPLMNVRASNSTPIRAPWTPQEDMLPFPVRKDLQRGIKRQRLSPSVAAAPNQPKGLPVKTRASWTPQEDMLLAAAVEVCDKGDWLPVAARVPGRRMLDCRTRWTILAARASRTSVGVVETCGEGKGLRMPR
jgi:hypothetical protein